MALALVGWGLSILLQVAPHEDPLVGLGLLVVGAALLLSGRRWPSVRSVSGGLTLAAGVFAVLGILAYGLIRDAPLNLTKMAILAYGGLLIAAGSLLLWARVSWQNRSRIGTAVVLSLPAVGAPLVTWAVQAGFKALAGSTPLEAFVHFGLLVPLGFALGMAGWQPLIVGQQISYSTPNGPLLVEVGAACSGVQAMALFGGVIALYMFLERPAGRSLVAWSAIGLLGVYLANLLRITVVLAAGYGWGAEALVRVHEQAGWMFFVAWSVAFSMLVRARGVPRDPPTRRAEGAAMVAFKE